VRLVESLSAATTKPQSSTHPLERHPSIPRAHRSFIHWSLRILLHPESFSAAWMSGIEHPMKKESNEVWNRRITRKRENVFKVTAVEYTEPEYNTTVGLFAEGAASKASIDVDVYRNSLECNYRAITESDTNGMCKIIYKEASRAGELIDEVTLAMEH
jgi:hypothetical protein